MTINFKQLGPEFLVMKPVISTCCFVFQQIKETGGLKKLVALITDQPPPDDEPKGAKGGEKKAGSRAAKKSAKGDCEYYFYTCIPCNEVTMVYSTPDKKGPQ